MKRFISIISILLTSNLGAQEFQTLNSGQILQELKQLNCLGSVLYLAAHPDDENTRLLAYLVGEKHYRTAYLALTRGDGGQNLIGNEQGAALGLIRTQELLAARRTDGAMQFFTRAIDFGYSKNPEETFNVWNKDSVLADVVWTIRQFKPDVIICRFPTTGEGGHGHHTASAILAEEAFKAAADSTKFPEQLKYTHTWQAKRLFWNTFQFGSINTTAPNQLKIDVGGFNPLLGKSYGEIAADSRSMHKSQGFGVAKQRGVALEYFKFLLGDKKPDSSLFDAINTNWSRLRVKNDIGQAVQKCIEQFNPLAIQKSVPQLIEIYTKIQNLPVDKPTDVYWKNKQLERCKNLIVQCAGIWMEAYAQDYSAVPGDSLSLSAAIILRNKINAQLNDIQFVDKNIHLAKQLPFDQLQTFKQNYLLNKSASYSSPYWLNDAPKNNLYHVNNQLLIGQAENKPALSVLFSLSIMGTNIEIERPITYKYTDPIKGEVYRPLEILPKVCINLSSKAYLFNTQIAKKIFITLKANSDNCTGKLKAILPKAWKLTFADTALHLEKKGDELRIEAHLFPLDSAQKGEVSIFFETEDAVYNKSIERIEYDHIPYQFSLSEASAQINYFSFQTADKKIAYLPGSGDKVAECLQQVGFDVKIIDADFIAQADLRQFDCIITGVRAFNTNKKLMLYHDKLMDFIKNGGNLLVQYNTNNRHAPLTDQIGPYPFTISQKRVTNENAAVKFLDPNAAVLNIPNKISSADFEGWIQERGTYFATDIDKNYQTVLSMHDAHEPPLDGSLIIGDYGLGHFIYTGLVFFRQLPAGTTGAYRLMANLINL
jgi:LmbE family N-acetylglucosaminyl deacetylase